MTRVIKQKYDIDSANNAQTLYCDDGSEVLQSYETQVLRRYSDGTLYRLWNGWSATTGKHIKAFCGLNKKQYLELHMGKRWEEDNDCGI